jgi:hypothetical protein
MTIRLVVPAHLEQITDRKPGVVFGNFLNMLSRNAPAYRKKTDLSAFRVACISIRLLIVRDNSFIGVIPSEQRRLLSAKCQEYGIGTVSVATVESRTAAHSSRRAARFLSFVYMRMCSTLPGKGKIKNGEHHCSPCDYRLEKIRWMPDSFLQPVFCCLAFPHITQ